MDEVPMNCNMLVSGPTGCGKTYSITKTVEKYSKLYNLYVPLIKIDATMLTREGWEGESLSNYLREEYDTVYSTLYNKELTTEFGENDRLAQANFEAKIKHEAFQAFERAIIYVDEIDKLARGDDKGHTKGVQTNFLLWLMPDSTVKLSRRNYTSINVETKYITFMFSGAFQDMYDEVDVKMKSIGFVQDETPEPEKEVTGERLIEYGLMKEFVYRVPYVFELEQYSKESLKTIISNDEVVEMYRTRYDLKVTIEELVDYVHKHPAGMRALYLYLANKDLNEPDNFELTQERILNDEPVNTAKTKV
jgi:ATP-dependent protease Clp ATPase subunit